MIVKNNNQKLHNFKAWSGAADTKQTILDHHKSEDFEFLIEELFPEGLTDTQLNDLLWFEEEWIYKQLNIKNQ